MDHPRPKYTFLRLANCPAWEDAAEHKGTTDGVLPDLCSGEQELVKTPMIAIVDDDGAVLESTRALVRSLGYNASTFIRLKSFWIPIRVILAV